MKREGKNNGNNPVTSVSLIQIFFAIFLGILFYLACRSYTSPSQTIIYTAPVQYKEAQVSVTHALRPTDEIPVTQAADKIFSSSVYKFQILVPVGWQPNTTEIDMDEKLYAGNSLVMWSSTAPQLANGTFYGTADKHQIKVDVLINTEGKNTLSEAKKAWEDPNDFNQEDGTYNSRYGKYRIQDISFKGKPAFEVTYDRKDMRHIIVIGGSEFKYDLAYYDFDGNFSAQDNVIIQKIFDSFIIQ